MADGDNPTDLLRSGDRTTPGDPMVPAADTSDVGSLVASALEMSASIVQSGGNAPKQVMTGWTHEPIALHPGIESSTRALRGRLPTNRVPHMVDIDKAARDVFVMPDDDLQQLQYKLFAAGFYGNARFEEIGWRTPGPETFMAFTKFLDFATEWRGNDGKEQPWFQVLDELAGTGTELDANAQSMMGGVEPTQVNQLTDPAALRTTFDRTAQSVLGRKLGSREQRAFVSMIHDLQRQTSSQLYGAQAGGGGSVDVVQPSVEAQALEFARGQDPNLARANDTAKTYESFLNIIGGR